MTIDELEQIRHMVNWIAIAAWCAMALWHMRVSDADRRDAKSYRKLLGHMRGIILGPKGNTHVPAAEDGSLIKDLIERMDEDKAVWMPDTLDIEGRQQP